MISQAQLQTIVLMDDLTINKVLSHMTLKEALRWRREIQQALAEYARHHKYDRVQCAAIGTTMAIERSCRRGFYLHRMRSLQKQDPQLPSRLGKIFWLKVNNLVHKLAVKNGQNKQYDEIRELARKKQWQKIYKKEVMKEWEQILRKSSY